MAPTCKSRRRAPRMTSWTIITLLLLVVIAALAPQQLQVVLYKAALVTFGATLAYWIDRSLFPEGRPHECGGDPFVIAAAWLRRALIVLACVVGLTLGL